MTCLCSLDSSALVSPVPTFLLSSELLTFTGSKLFSVWISKFSDSFRVCSIRGVRCDSSKSRQKVGLTPRGDIVGAVCRRWTRVLEVPVPRVNEESSRRRQSVESTNLARRVCRSSD